MEESVSQTAWEIRCPVLYKDSRRQQPRERDRHGTAQGSSESPEYEYKVSTASPYLMDHLAHDQEASKLQKTV